MSEFEIKTSVAALLNAVNAGDEGAGAALALELVGQALVDLNRIARALETIASPPAPAS